MYASYIQLASANKHKFYFVWLLEIISGVQRLSRKLISYIIFQNLVDFFAAWVASSVLSFILNALILYHPQFRFYILSMAHLSPNKIKVNGYLFASVSISSRQGPCLFFLHSP